MHHIIDTWVTHCVSTDTGSSSVPKHDLIPQSHIPITTTEPILTRGISAQSQSPESFNIDTHDTHMPQSPASSNIATQDLLHDTFSPNAPSTNDVPDTTPEIVHVPSSHIFAQPQSPENSNIDVHDTHMPQSPASSSSATQDIHHDTFSLNAPSINDVPDITPEIVHVPPSHPAPHHHHMTTRSQLGVVKPNPKYALSIETSHTIPLEPKSVKAALSHPGWKKAMIVELATLHQSQTWKLVPCTSNMHVIGSKWVYKPKLKPDGTLDRLKAHIVAKGYHQISGLDYTETFSPVIRPGTIRLILTVALVNHWPVRQLDVKNAFLHGYIVENIYIWINLQVWLTLNFQIMFVSFNVPYMGLNRRLVPGLIDLAIF